MESKGFAEEQAPLRSSTNDKDNSVYEMTNLYPQDTGLPMTVWVSPRGNARHDVRINVCLTPGKRMVIGETAVVGVRPQPRLIEGELSPEGGEAGLLAGI